MRLRNILILLIILVVLAGGYSAYYFLGRPNPEPTTPPRVFLWDIEDNDLQHIVISLPNEGKSQAFIKMSEGDKFPWYFDDAQKSPVDPIRWGGGIPLLLSGPGADRVIKKDATEEELATYGLTEPSMVITLTLFNGTVLQIDVGDSTPDGNNYYIRPPDTNGVATVDYTWYEVLANLVINPPYVSAE